MTKENAEEKIRELQMAEQSLQQLLSQKQNLQMQLMEIDTALKGLEDTTEAYKIVGNVMVLSDKTKLQEELQSKKETTQLRIKTIDTQEKSTQDKATATQKEVMEEMKNDNKDGKQTN